MSNRFVVVVVDAVCHVVVGPLFSVHFPGSLNFFRRKASSTMCPYARPLYYIPIIFLLSKIAFLAFGTL